MMVAAKLQSYIVQICSLPLVRILQTLAIACAGFLTQVSQLSKDIGDSAHTVSAQKSNISKKMSGGEVLNLFLSKDHGMTLTFCQVIVLLYTRSKLTKSFTLLSAPVLASRIYTPRRQSLKTY